MITENENIIVTQKENIDYMQFKKLLSYPEITHAYILKTHDMNFRVGKNFRLIDTVKNNLKIVCKDIGFKYDTIIRPDYNHTNNVDIVDEVKSINNEPDLKGERFIDVDGLITNKTEITIMSTNADCGLILLYDPIKKVIGNVHAGWRGTFGKIAKNAVEKMVKEYDVEPQNIEAYLCPSIRKCHFEVDTDVKELCEEIFKYTNRLNEIIELGEVKDGKQKYNIDCVLINKILLEEIGVKKENIFDSKICSVCNNEMVHSRRVEGEFFGLRSSIYFIKIMIEKSIKIWYYIYIPTRCESLEYYLEPTV